MAIAKIKLTRKKLSSLAAAVIISAASAILIFISLFLYKNFYQTITQTKEILILKEKVAVDMVDMEKFNMIIKKLEEKTKPGEFQNIISPFR
ncbi:MAG: hypothetical protein V1667_02835 [bacterium]